MATSSARERGGAGAVHGAVTFLRRAALAALLLSPAAHAAVQHAAADGFLVAFSEPVAAAPAKAWADLVQVQRWWSDEHTFSGDAAHLSLAASAGGCFCERWSAGSVEHARVLMALPQRLLRLEGALGPLQELALHGVLSFWIRTDEDGATRLDVEYRVNGSAASALEGYAPQVDAMLGEQVARLTRFIASGSPEPAIAAAQTPALPDVARAQLLELWRASLLAEPAVAPPKPKPPQHP